MNKKYKATHDEITSVKISENELKQRIIKVEKASKQTADMLVDEKKTSTVYKKEAEINRQKYLRIKAEKKSFKQKADSLAKEMSRICKNNMGINDIEKIIHEHGLMMIEVELLRSQKRKALEELKECNIAYDNSVQAQKRAGTDGEVMRALEQRAELERVIAELTEYLNAKEMQLGTMREVNRSLTNEIHELAKTNLSKNEV